MTLKNILLNVFVLGLTACGGTGNRVPEGVPVDSIGMITLDLSAFKAGPPMSLDEIANDIRVIRLETTEESLIRNFSGYVGDRYIIAVDYRKVMLFSSEGDFSGLIAVRGNGPGEFRQIDAWDVTAGESSFIYHDRGKDRIDVYSLDSNEHAESVPFIDKGGLDDIVIMGDTLLALLASKFSTFGYLFFYQDYSGRIVSGLESEPVPHPGAWAGAGAVFIPAGNGKIVYQSADSDTVFLIEGTRMKPIFRLLVPDPEVSGYDEKGSFGRLKYIGEKYIFADQAWYDKNVSPEGASIGIDSVEFFIYYRKEQKMQKVAGFKVTFQGIELDLQYIGLRHRGRFFSHLQAYNFISMVTEKQATTELNDSQKRYWSEMLASIKETDNPIIITGMLY